ncbi:MAG: hypothetical protein IJ274_14865 [Lachnospiraceae bacterium]|nr:hypothetical protein [Lachnospiraceae bacterium]
MNYKDYTLAILDNLGIHQVFRGCEYIMYGIEYLLSLEKNVAPDSEMIYNFAAEKFVLEPTAIENSMRNVIQAIWTNKENPQLMQDIFGAHNMDKRPSNLEFLMLLYNYIRHQKTSSDTLTKLDEIWENSKRVYLESKQTINLQNE